MGLWEFDNRVYACFVNLEQVCDCVPLDILLGVLCEYRVQGAIVMRYLVLV